tara:strand:- start:43 stop:1023 length:981 start_codon:yes stop_codon:yes gene_type:complete
MKKSTLIIAVVALATVCSITAQDKKKTGPTTWKEKAAARFGDTPTKAHKTEIKANIPTPTAKPKAARKVLVFFRCETFIHTSIPFCNFAMQAIEKQTGAFSVDLADEYEVFTSENLAQYDAIIFNNTTSLDPNEEQRAAILEFVNGGKGIVGFHAAADNFKDWPEGIALMGGIFNGHPWTGGGTWAFKLDDTDHPLNAAFKGKGFWHKDEIYRYKDESFQGREKLRVLLSLDMTKVENQKPIGSEKFKKDYADPSKVDLPVSWCREVGKGRLFYTNLGHNDMTFANKTVLLHMLDGIQFALGDLEADTVPSTEANAKLVHAPDAAE